jgi:hypothetical protein
MKIIKRIIIVLVLTVTLITTQSGCNKKDEDNQTLSPEFAPTRIQINSEINAKKAIIDVIDVSRNISEKGKQDNNNFKVNKIPELKEFYIPMKIDGFYLNLVDVDDYGFAFYYMPVENEKNNDEYYSLYDDAIEIIITRPESRPIIFDFNEYFKEVAEINNELFTEDNFVYSKHNYLHGQIGDTTFRISAPYKMGTYEYLRDLAFDLIKNAELVNVQHELDVMKQSKN